MRPVVPVFKGVVERSLTKKYHHLGLGSVLSKIFEKSVSNTLLNHLQKCGITFLFSLVSCIHVQRQIFWQLYLRIVLFSATQTVTLCISKTLFSFGILVVFTSISPVEFFVWFFVKFVYFCAKENFEQFSMERHQRSAQSWSVFFRAPLWVLIFSVMH